MSARELITDHLDLWTRAVTKKSSSGRGSNGKVELTGIKKLRELTLELAVRGLLTEQRIDESNALEIVANLDKEQKQLVAAGLIKKPKPLKPIDENEKPYPLPKGWQWVRLGHTMEMYNGRAFKSSEWSTSGLPIVRIQNLNDPKAPTNYFFGPLDDRHSIDSGTFLISWSGTPGTSFGAFIWTRGPAALNQHINKCVFFGDFLNPEFMQLAVNGQMKNFIQSAQGGVGLKHVTKGVLANALIALPPREEQNHIVQKVDELMALCDRLEQQTSDQLEAHVTLVDTLLGTLTQSENATELADNWARLAAHFDTLFHTEHSIEKLKQTILQLAVMGRLVEHGCESEASPDATETNAPTRFQSNSQNKKKNRGSAVPISVTEKPFAVPNNWSWERIENLIESNREISYGIIKLGKEPQTGGVHTLRCSDVKPRYIDSSSVRRVTEEIESSYQRTHLEGGEVLLNIRGTLGGVALVPYELRGFNIAREVAMLPFSSSVFGPYMVNLIASPFFWKMIESNLKGIAYKGLNLSTLRSLAIPIPPVDEQKSIVQKTDELLCLCDQLKERLNQASETRCQLAGAVVEDALN